MKKFEEEFDNLMRAFVDYHDCCDFDTEKCYLGLEKEFIEKYGKKQQPEIPEFVAEWIKHCKNNEYNLVYSIARISHDYAKEIEEPLESEELIDWMVENENMELFALAFITGEYTVETPKVMVTPCPVCGFEDVEANFCGICGHKNEYVEVAKEKRFYLKNKFTGNYLSSVPESNDFYHIMIRDPKVNGLVRSFTQQEIDSMETGSYEQVEV